MIFQLALVRRIGTQLHTDDADDDLLTSRRRSPAVLRRDDGGGVRVLIREVVVLGDQNDEIVALHGAQKLIAVGQERVVREFLVMRPLPAKQG